MELLNLVEEREWKIGNGNARGNEEEWSYREERRVSVVDLSDSQKS